MERVVVRCCFSHRLVLSEALGRVEWIPPLTRFARSVGMTNLGGFSWDDDFLQIGWHICRHYSGQSRRPSNPLEIVREPSRQLDAGKIDGAEA